MFCQNVSLEEHQGHVLCSEVTIFEKKIRRDIMNANRHDPSTFNMSSPKVEEKEVSFVLWVSHRKKFSQHLPITRAV